ncbi:hypothetical protein KI387_019234, partial [Taxus chinensis]
ENPSKPKKWRTVQHVDNKLSAPLGAPFNHVNSKLSAPLAHHSACRQTSYQRPWCTVQHVDSKLLAPLAHRSAFRHHVR